jgi:hypothetical protein
MKFENVVIGGTVAAASTPTRAPIPPRSPFRNGLPHRLDAEACLAVIKSFDPSIDVTSIAAARASIDMDLLNEVLGESSLDLSERFRLKTALSAEGIISMGRSVPGGRV